MTTHVTFNKKKKKIKKYTYIKPKKKKKEKGVATCWAANPRGGGGWPEGRP
jgi:hypothetical protein